MSFVRFVLLALLNCLWVGFFSSLFLPILSSGQSYSSCVAEVSKIVEAEQIFKDPQWLRLLHFRRTFPFFRSQVDDPKFFLSSEGHKNPEAEMRAFIEALCVPQSKPARCQFPARESFLLQKSGLKKTPWPQTACHKLEEWRKNISAESVSLVFSSYYPNNPGTVFGHTLFKINKKNNSSLLSQGISFAASAETKNPIQYILWGLFGGFRGEFSSLPYFYKVREYSDAESRDLWEYDLNLTEAELNLFIDHIWELGPTYFNYYYLTENCSYQLLTALEAALPQLNASEKLSWWVIPSDTLKAVVNTKNLVKKIHFRPSLYRQYLNRYEKIKDHSELKVIFQQIVHQKKLDHLKNLDPRQQALVMDAGLDYWEYKNFHELSDSQSLANQFKNKMLQTRSQMPVAEEIDNSVDENLRPDLSHGSMRYGLGIGYDHIDKGLADMDVRFALHDFLDSPQGMPDHSKIDVFHFRGRFYEDLKKIKLDSFRFAELQSLAPTSWRVALGAERTWHLFCDGCFSADFLLQGGSSIDLSSQNLAYALAGVHIYWPEGIGTQAAPQLNIGFKQKWSSSIHSLLEGEWQHVLGPHHEAYRYVRLETRYHLKKDWTLSADFKKGDNNDFQSLFKIFIYR